MAVTRSYVELLLGRDELAPLFHACFDENFVDHLGYDLRLGERIEHVTTGVSKDLENDEETVIFPGETVIVKTEEVLHLPDDVYAIGSPKMSLLIKGLWAHGGKTDFGYNLSLTLGFQNVGSNPITIKRCDPIFHLTFYRVHNKETTTYAGGGAIFPSRNVSPLDDNELLSKTKIEEVKTIDGIKSFRLIKQIQYVNNRIGYAYYVPSAAILVILLAQILPSYGVISENISSQLTLLSSIIGLIFGAYPILKAAWNWIKKRN